MDKSFEAFSQAVESGDAKQAQELLQSNPSLRHNPILTDKKTLGYALCSAAQHDYAEIVRLFLELEADVDFRANWRNWTPLHYAAWHGSPNAAEILCVNGADMEARDEEDYTALFLSLRHKFMPGGAVVGILLHHSAKLDLLSAIGLGQNQLVRCLLKNDPALLRTDLHAKDFVPLATALGNTDLIQLLSECGADMNACRYYKLPLIEAMQGTSRKGARNMVRFLLGLGADPRRKPTPDEESALEWATKHAPRFVLLLSRHH